MNASTLMSKYAKFEVKVKTTEATNPHRVTLGNLFMQPTGGKASKPFNFSYCYLGMIGKTGKFIGGFSMSNMALLEAIEAGHLDKSFYALFEAYAETHVAQEREVLKAK